MGAEFQLVKPFLQPYYGHLYEVCDAPASDLHVVSLWLQTRTVTGRTVRLSPITGEHHTVLDLILVLLDHLEKLVDAGLFLGALV